MLATCAEDIHRLSQGLFARLRDQPEGLLAEFVRSAGRVLVPDHLLAQVWGPGYEGEVQMVRQAGHRLRRKIEPDPQNPRYIETRHGIGYVFAAPDR